MTITPAQAEAYLRTDLRGLDVFVAEDLLDEADIGAALVHVCCHAVPQQVAGSGVANVRGDDLLPHRPRQMIAAERLTLRCEEDGGVLRLDGELRSAFMDVFFEPCDGTIPDRVVAVFFALALPHQDEAAVERVVEPQLDPSLADEGRSSTAPPKWLDRPSRSAPRCRAAASRARSPRWRGCSSAASGPAVEAPALRPGCGGCDSTV